MGHKRGASKSRGLWEGYQSAWEAANWGNEKPKEIDSQKSASRHVELPLAFDQSNTPPERMLVDNGKAAASTDALRIDAVQNCFEETTKADKPKGTSKKKRSAVWEHFVEIIIDDTVWADCKHCKKRFAGGSKEAGTSTLRRHLDKLHGIEIPKASSSKNENLCVGPATSKPKTPTPSLLPSLAPVALKPPGTTTQRKKRTDGANDLATQEVCGRGKRTRRRDNPRFRQVDGTWRRELYKDSEGTQSPSGLASRNLQARQKSHLKQSTEVVKKSSVPDLREKLSGVQRPQLNSMVQIPKPAVAEIAKSAKPVQKRELSAPAPAPALPVTKNVNEPTAPKQSQEKADSSLDRLLKSLDLQKYSINFQAEEVDMKALVHMNEEDMKSLGIPMGPRKKILSALASKRKKSSKSLPPTS